MVKDTKWVVALAVPAVACVVYGMVRGDNPVFLVGLALGIAAYLLYRKRYREFIREKYGERKKLPQQE
jgi:uncharacterized membrane protein